MICYAMLCQCELCLLAIDWAHPYHTRNRHPSHPATNPYRKLWCSIIHIRHLKFQGDRGCSQGSGNQCPTRDSLLNMGNPAPDFWTARHLYTNTMCTVICGIFHIREVYLFYQYCTSASISVKIRQKILQSW